jgi:hypothetical protein
MRLSLVLLVIGLCGCASARPALDATLQECRSSIPAQYEYIELAKDEKQKLLDGIETASKDTIICEVEIDRRRYEACSPDLWKLENKERRIEQPSIEGICVVS